MLLIPPLPNLGKSNYDASGRSCRLPPLYRFFRCSIEPLCQYVITQCYSSTIMTPLPTMTVRLRFLPHDSSPFSLQPASFSLEPLFPLCLLIVRFALVDYSINCTWLTLPKATLINIANEVDKLCNQLPASFSGQCHSFVKTNRDNLIKFLSSGRSAEYVCKAIQLCNIQNDAVQTVNTAAALQQETTGLVLRAEFKPEDTSCECTGQLDGFR